MTDTPTAATTFYSPFTQDWSKGLEGFSPEDFHPCKGTILVVVPPAIKQLGSIHLPDAAEIDQHYARVAAIPDDHTDCPVRCGDMVVLRVGAGSPVKFDDRDDLALINYGDGPESEILGWIGKDDLDDCLCV